MAHGHHGSTTPWWHALGHVEFGGVLIVLTLVVGIVWWMQSQHHDN
jgi:heme/copper-type cytochrome/quinol oxidase subunit 4